MGDLFLKALLVSRADDVFIVLGRLAENEAVVTKGAFKIRSMHCRFRLNLA